MSEGEPWVQASVRTYRGRLTEGGLPIVTVDEGEGSNPLESAMRDTPFGWGRSALPGSAPNLAMSILVDVLGDREEAHRLRLRFMHRIVMLWTSREPWWITKKDVLATVDAIKQAEREYAPERAAVMRQVAPVVGGGAPIVPIETSPEDAGVDRFLDRPQTQATADARASALEKLTPEERRALGL